MRARGCRSRSATLPNQDVSDRLDGGKWNSSRSLLSGPDPHYPGCRHARRSWIDRGRQERPTTSLQADNQLIGRRRVAAQKTCEIRFRLSRAFCRGDIATLSPRMGLAVRNLLQMIGKGYATSSKAGGMAYLKESEVRHAARTDGRVLAKKLDSGAVLRESVEAAGNQ